MQNSKGQNENWLSQHLEQVIQVQHAVATCQLDLATVIQMMAERTQQITGATGATVEFAEGDEMVYRGASGTAQAHLGLRLKIASSLTGLSYRTGDVLICTDSETDPRVDREACRKVGLRSMIVVPLKHGDARVGVLKVFSDQPGSFSETEVRTLQLMSGLLGACLGHGAEFEARKAAEAELSQMVETLEVRVADRTRELRHSNDELQKALSIRDEFLCLASHELRTPLTSMWIQFSALNRKLEAGQLPGETELKRLSTVFERQMTRLRRLTSDLVDVAQLSSGEHASTAEPLDLTELAREVLEAWQGELARAKCALTFSASGSVLGRWDRMRLEQLTTILLSNAVKFGAGKAITVEVKQAGAAAVLSVTDEGMGLSPERVKEVFGRFERAGASINHGGLGIGLYLANEIAHMYGGEIRVESEVGHGARFEVRLQRGPAEVSQSTSARAAVATVA